VTCFTQRPLFCRDCGAPPAVAGLCAVCYRQRRHSLRYFAGLREEVLARDGCRCRGCGAGNQRAVHHRRPGVQEIAWLVTLCPACHALVHKLRRHRHWLPASLLGLWREQHPEVPLQLQLWIAPDLFGVSFLSAGEDGARRAA
jgi:5-methylcytosine-specific restriction endonuclease McrA